MFAICHSPVVDHVYHYLNDGEEHSNTNHYDLIEHTHVVTMYYVSLAR